jgi:hypothetical protein
MPSDLRAKKPPSRAIQIMTSPMGKSGQARYFLFVLGRIDRPAVISLDLPGFQA